MLRKAGKLIILIVVAAFIKFGAEISVVHREVQVAKTHAPRHALRSASPTHAGPKKHLDSYYDPTSSHYMGGAHNVALAQLSEEPLVDISDTYRGKNLARFNAQHAAYEDISTVWANARARNEEIADRGSIMSTLGKMYKSGFVETESSSDHANFKQQGSFIAFMALGSMSVVYFITFKNYHGSLQKLETLTALFNNPNARVAAGKKGKKLMKKINAVQEQPEEKPVVKKEKVAKPMTESEHTLNKVKELLEQKKQLAVP